MIQIYVVKILLEKPSKKLNKSYWKVCTLRFFFIIFTIEWRSATVLIFFSGLCYHKSWLVLFFIFGQTKNRRRSKNFHFFHTKEREQKTFDVTTFFCFSFFFVAPIFHCLSLNFLDAFVEGVKMLLDKLSNKSYEQIGFNWLDSIRFFFSKKKKSKLIITDLNEEFDERIHQKFTISCIVINDDDDCTQVLVELKPSTIFAHVETQFMSFQTILKASKMTITIAPPPPFFI